MEINHRTLPQACLTPLGPSPLSFLTLSLAACPSMAPLGNSGGWRSVVEAEQR
jgi:hypothetical protein